MVHGNRRPQPQGSQLRPDDKALVSDVADGGG